jgi:tripartite-type tricarboxylate transporter receptor subunit TctC
MMSRIIACVMLIATAQAAVAQTFAGKTLQVLVGYGAGGGTDAAARLVAQYLPHYLPGVPIGIVRNMPGAEGIVASNYFAQQIAPDGLTIMMESSTQADPNIYRKPQSRHDASKFEVIGGIGRGGTVLVLRKDAQPRLVNKQAQPVVMGVTGAVPRSGMQAAAWGVEALGWNVRWVTGYRGTEDLVLALERGEIDMTSTGNMFQLQKLRDSGRYVIVSQSGSFVDGKFVARADFGDAPLMPERVGEKMTPGLQSKAFAYWANLTAIDKWLVLPTGTPLELRNLYRHAFAETLKDPQFVEQSKKIGDDFVPMSAEDVELLVQRLADTPPDAIAFIDDMLRKQGLSVEQ